AQPEPQPPPVNVSCLKEGGTAMADDNKTRKCKHANCDCTVAGDDDYCSVYCHDADKTHVTDIACSCEHDACR
ncbi:MAG TPA: hypothetical protein VF507_01270, partial [Pyrinomonadaceae bacterium]